jgi:hypothetical protein
VRDPDWLREPVPLDESIVYVSVPEGAKLTPQIAEALTHLSRALHHLDRAPDSTPPCFDYFYCNGFSFCYPYVEKNCAFFTSCRIKE